MGDNPHHFDTPSWLGPTRRPQAEDTILPTQAEPFHDALAPDHLGHLSGQSVVRPAAVPDAASWEERARPQLVVGTIIGLAVLAIPVLIVLIATLQSARPAVGVGVCILVIVLARSMLMSAGLSRVELKGPRLTVHRDGLVDGIDLANAFGMVQVAGDPRERSWRLTFETVDGRVHELNGRQVDAVTLDAAVKYYAEVGQGHGPRHAGDDAPWRG